MARITVEDCLEKVPNRFSLVLVAAERTKQLLKGATPLLEEDIVAKNKEIVLALREIASGAVQADLSDFDENEFVDGQLFPHEDGAETVAADDLPPEA